MNKTVRVLLALGVLAGGAGLALLFRLESDEAVSDTARDTLARAADGSESSGRAARPPAIAPRQAPATNWAEQSEPLPQLAPSDPGGALSSPLAGRRHGLRRGALPAAASGPAQTHEIVDGDTLQEIARQYLGSASLAGKIFEANRARLSDPDLLPLGVELTIPSGVQGTGATKGSPNRQPLVPVAPRGRPAQRTRSAAVGR